MHNSYVINITICCDSAFFICVSDLIHNVPVNMSEQNQPFLDSKGVNMCCSRTHLAEEGFYSGILPLATVLTIVSLLNYKMSRLVGKPTMWFLKKVRHKPGCTSTEDG